MGLDRKTLDLAHEAVIDAESALRYSSAVEDREAELVKVIEHLVRAVEALVNDGHDVHTALHELGVAKNP